MARNLVTLTVVGIVAATTAALATGAGEATQGPVGVCVQKASGAVRVAAQCRANEYPLTLGGGGVALRTVTTTRDYDQPDGAYLGIAEVTAACGSGERVTGGGGYGTNDKYGGIGYLVSSRPGADGASWVATFNFPDGASHGTAYAICAT
jgi:hypothetical protein